MAAKLLGFCEELRGEGVAVGTSEILDAFAALGEVGWTSRADFREALATTIAKSQDDRRVFELLFDRYFFRTAEAEAVQRGVTEHAEGGPPAGDGERFDMDELSEAIREAIAAGDEDAMRDLARLAIAAFGPRRGLRRGRGRRAADPPHPWTDRRHAAADAGRRRAAADRPRPADRLRAPPAARARARPDRADRDPASLRAPWPSSTGRCRPARPRTSPPSTAPSRR